MLNETLIAVIIAYLLGSVSSAIIVCKLFHLPDPRTLGSQNPGASNVLRLGGKKAALITLLGDALKSFIPVLIAKSLMLPPPVIAATAFAAFWGHLYPIFFSFQGGKGVATFLGALLALSWPAGLCWMALWVLVAVIFRFASLASLIASFSAIFFIAYFLPTPIYFYLILLMNLFILIRHRGNIKNLWEGREARLGEKTAVLSDRT